MKIESLVADVTSVGSPVRAERNILRMFLDFFGNPSSAWTPENMIFGMVLLGAFLANLGHFCGQGATL